MTGRSSRRRRDRPRWHVAPVDPPGPAEVTQPVPVARCARCATGDSNAHVWAELDREVLGRVTLRRLVCVCDRCGRCDGQLVQVALGRG